MFTREDVRALYDKPLLSLLDEARAVHRAHHPDEEVQLCTLLSVKTGGCPEDCAYCPQSSRYETAVGPERDARRGRGARCGGARQASMGSTRFCMGAAWREVKDGPAFDRVLAMVRGVKALGLEACVTLGMLTEIAGRAAQRRRPRRVQPQPRHESRELPLDHLDAHVRRSAAHARSVRAAGHHGLLAAASSGWARASTTAARCSARSRTSSRSPRACRSTRSCRSPGTPLAASPPVDPLDLVRMVACARILMPRSRVRLSAGRTELIARGAAAVPLRGRELDLLRRQAAHDAQPGRRGRPLAHPRRRPTAMPPAPAE